MKAAEFISGILFIAGGIGLFFLANSQAAVMNRTYDGTKTFTSISEATLYQQDLIINAQKDNAKVNSNISVASPPVVNWTVIEPDTKTIFSYGKIEKDTAQLEIDFGGFCLVALPLLGIIKIISAR